jgi:hypothetical protein
MLREHRICKRSSKLSGSAHRSADSLLVTRSRGLRVNGEWIHVNKSPVGYTAYPMPVGANRGNIFHPNFEMKLSRAQAGPAR